MQELERWRGRSEARHRNGLQIIMIGLFSWRYPWIKGSNGYRWGCTRTYPFDPTIAIKDSN